MQRTRSANGPKPRMIKSVYIGPVSVKIKPHFICASFELGNTTTKCILTATNLDSGKTYLLNKIIRMTRETRIYGYSNDVIGETVTGLKLTGKAVEEIVKDTLLKSIEEARIDIADLDFVVRSTGVTAGFTEPAEVDMMIKALANGCLAAKIPARKMMAALSNKDLSNHLSKYSKLDNYYFEGAIAAVRPPARTEIVANEMEGELVTAGIKAAAISSGIDFRNPVLTLDFGTTLAGRITNDEIPFAKTIGSFCGLAGAIPDALIRGTDLVDKNFGCVLDAPIKDVHPKNVDIHVIEDFSENIFEYLYVGKVPVERKRIGMVPVNTKAAKKAKVTLIGCDAGINGTNLSKLGELGKEFFEEFGKEALHLLIDFICAKLAMKLIEVAIDEDLIFNETSVGITGRAGITGKKPEFLVNLLRELDLKNEEIIFQEDGLAHGAAMAARCLNLLGTPKTPVGGRKGGSCVLKLRKCRI